MKYMATYPGGPWFWFATEEEAQEWALNPVRVAKDITIFKALAQVRTATRVDHWLEKIE